MTMTRPNKASQEEKLLELFKTKPLVRTRDILALNISPRVLYRLLKMGKIVKTTRGVLCLPGVVGSEHQTLMEIALLVPKGVICLLSALRFHDIGTQNPPQVWVAIDRKAKKPRVKNINLRIVRFSASALRYGVEKHNIQGVPVQVTNPAKTIADCFKYRNKIGLDVALETLQDGWRSRCFTLDELYRAAKVCRVTNVIRPYVEAMI